MILVVKQNKSAPEAGRTRDPSNSAVSKPFQTVPDLVLEAGFIKQVAGPCVCMWFTWFLMLTCYQ